MRSLSILFTNSTLSHRAGSELWVRDVCRALVARRHRPMAFSLVTGPVAGELRAATVPVVTDLDSVALPPDLIHGHHHLETLIAALQFPAVPIVHFCHGWLPWEEKPLRHPSIVRYVAVDDTCADRLTREAGIPPERVDRLLNFVDLRRFAPRSPLPPRPRRALVLSNGAANDGFAAVIREACRDASIELEVAGAAAGRVIEYPEEMLPHFDLVFAKARTALEALAVGCSVILSDAAGCGPMVNTRDLDWMRRCNFGVRVLQQPHSVEWYRKQIAAYDTADAALASERVRQDADLEGAVDRLLDIYHRALDEHARLGSPMPAGLASAEAQRAAARHLCSIAARVKDADALARKAASLSRDLQAAQALTEMLANERGALQESLARADREVAEFRALPAIRMRDALVRVPFLGATARHAARWLARAL
jgi:hypothetical protein